MFAESDNVISDKDFDFFGIILAPVKREFYLHVESAHLKPNSQKIICYCDPILFKSILHLDKVRSAAIWNSRYSKKNLDELAEISLRGVDFKVKEQMPMTLIFEAPEQKLTKVINFSKYL